MQGGMQNETTTKPPPKKRARKRNFDIQNEQERYDQLKYKFIIV